MEGHEIASDSRCTREVRRCAVEAGWRESKQGGRGMAGSPSPLPVLPSPHPRARSPSPLLPPPLFRHHLLAHIRVFLAQVRQGNDERRAGQPV